MIWLDTRTPAEAEQRRTAMWGIVRTDTDDGGMTAMVNGEGLYEGDRFWADAIKDTYDDPPRRLEMAKHYMPLPAAFREACIALRAVIREKKKAGKDFDADLLELHHWAAVQSIAWYDELDITPYSEIASLDLAPPNIGWDELPMLNKTDRKLMSDLWPQPARHTTGTLFYPEIERAARVRLEEQRRADQARRTAEFHAEIDAILANENSATAKAARLESDAQTSKGNRGIFEWIFAR